jgi:insertion element IS1 protein InsB
MNCPRWRSEPTAKNERVHHGQAKRRCKDCRRQFIPDATNTVITPQTWERIDKLLLKTIPLAGLARVTALSADDLQEYVNRTYETVLRVARVRAPTKVG